MHVTSTSLAMNHITVITLAEQPIDGCITVDKPRLLSISAQGVDSVKEGSDRM